MYDGAARMDPPLVDTRPERDFVQGHVPGAAGFPLEELPARVHELPPRDQPLRLTDDEPDRAERAARILRARGHAVDIVSCPPPDARAETGPSRAQLWRPSPLLPFALTLIARHGPGPGRRALDVACGAGRDAVFLALAGYEVEAIDVLDDALARARDLARRNGVVLRTIRQDLEQGPVALPRAAYGLVTVFRYLHRPLLPDLAEAVAPGGYLVYETFHERNLATGRPPRRRDHLVRDGELPAAFPSFELLHHADALERDGRHFSQLITRRPPAPPVAGPSLVHLQDDPTMR